MSTPSMVLLFAGAAASLSGVWALAGLSERSKMLLTPRVILAGAVGVLGLSVVHFRAAPELRGDLGLPALFGLAAVLALTAGSAKLDAALVERDGRRALRRSAGLLAGTALGMAAVAAVSLELVQTSLVHARLGWAYMLPILASTIVVFADRVRLAGGGALALGARGLVAALVGLVLLAGGRAAVAPRLITPDVVEAPPPLPRAAPPIASSGEPVAKAPVLAESAPAPSAAPAVSAPAAAALGGPGELVIEALVARGIFEADARGGVMRRFDKLQACASDPKNQQSGSLTLKVGIDAAGSVDHSRASGGDLVGTPLAECLLPVFYKMGFAAPASSSAHFEITLRAPPR
jgi:hypothetical protein